MLSTKTDHMRGLFFCALNLDEINNIIGAIDFIDGNKNIVTYYITCYIT